MYQKIRRRTAHSLEDYPNHQESLNSEAEVEINFDDDAIGQFR